MAMGGLSSAVELLGCKKVLNYLSTKNQQRPDSSSSSSPPPPSPLYWRSQLLVAASPLEQWPTNTHTLWFVDITFEFQKNVSIQATMGFYLLRRPPPPSRPSSKAAVYVQSKPFTQQTLEDHAENIHIDLTSAPAKAMAGMMANALMKLGPNNNSNDTVKDPVQLVGESKDDTSTKIQLDLFYQDLQETGTLSLDVHEQTSALDGLGILPLYQAICNPPAQPPAAGAAAVAKKEPSSLTTEDSDTQERNELLQEYKKWLHRKDGEGKANGSNKAPLAESSSPLKKRAKNPQIHQFQPLKKRSKKKKKITYAKP
eukprot:scaffold3702_cov126-Cylindrotheca_fusiformis.AAC.3